MSFASQFCSLFQVKFDWTDDEASFYMWIMQNCLFLGSAVGALLAGKFMHLGRRTIMLISCGIGIFGAALTLYLEFKIMVLGRFLLGLAMGLTLVSMLRYVHEYVPS